MKGIAVFSIALAMLLPSCGKKDDDSIAKKTGNKVGETLTDFASGVGKGIDKQMAVDVELSQEMKDKGISKTISKSLGFDSEGKGISVYFLSKDAIELNFVAKAANTDGLEVGRSTVEVKMAKDDAKYVKFIFDKEMDMQLVKKFSISSKEATSNKKDLEGRQEPQNQP